LGLSMGRYFNDNAESVGNTPLIKLNKVTKGAKANLFAKIEGRNPSSSVKCRIGASMIWDAEKRGILVPGVEVIEPTSGNTGIALASVSAARGYRLTLTMPETMSVERRRVLAAFGANVVLTPGPEGMSGAIRRAEEIVKTDPRRYFMPQQFKNPANPLIHETTTGPEIWEALGASVDVFVAGVGTGGTITGVSRFIKKTVSRNLVSVAVEPKESALISQAMAGEPLKPSPHKIQGIGAGFIPEILDLSLIDKVEQVDSSEAVEMTRRLAREEGILCGISSGAAMVAALRQAFDEINAGKNIVVILPDLGERYMSTVLFEGL